MAECLNKTVAEFVFILDKYIALYCVMPGHGQNVARGIFALHGFAVSVYMNQPIGQPINQSRMNERKKERRKERKKETK